MTTSEYSFGNWVRRRRKAIDLTQPELAARVGCSVSAIFKIESDERRPSRQIAKLLAKHLEIPNVCSQTAWRARLRSARISKLCSENPRAG